MVFFPAMGMTGSSLSDTCTFVDCLGPRSTGGRRIDWEIGTSHPAVEKVRCANCGVPPAGSKSANSRYVPGLGSRVFSRNQPSAPSVGCSCEKYSRSWLTRNKWKSFSCTVSKCVTGRPVFGSSTRNSRVTGRPAGMDRGTARKSSGNSTGSGSPATSFMPQRGQTPGALARTSRSIGHTKSGSCARKSRPIPANIQKRRVISRCT